MKNILVKNVKYSENKNVTLNGWVYNTRSSGKIGFLMLRDGTGIIQCIVVKNEVKSHVFEQFKKLTQESSITVNGIIVENLKAPGGYELLLKNLKIHQLVEGYPVTPKEHGTEFLMKNRHLWIRSKRQYSILKIRHEIIKATRDFFDMNDFTLVDTPYLYIKCM